jgi:hypothetical protein
MRGRHFVILACVFAGAVASVGLVWRASADNSPAISDVTVESVEATSTTVTWTTDRMTDSYVSVSQDTNYCSVRNAGGLSTTHTVVIPNLDPATSYFFKVRATDVDGNQGFSGDYTFMTSSTIDLSALNTIQNPAQKNLAVKAVSAIQQINNSQALQSVAQALNAQASAVIGIPKILGNPQVDIGVDQAVVSWNTDALTDGTVFIASDGEYNAGASNPYSREELDTDNSTMTHSVTVVGLSPSTEYHYKVSSKGAVGDAGESGDLTFTTKALLPSIINPHTVKVQEHDATIGWGTPLPTAGTVIYTNLSSRKALSVGDPSFLVTHVVQLNDLVFQTRYSAVIEAKNQAGDTVTSEPLYFITGKDIAAPIISQVNNDSTLYPGQDTKVQTIVSWQTDEPSECNLNYVSGVVKNDADTVKTPIETGFLVKHVNVVTTFTPATVYKYWVTCADVDGNTTSSEDFVLLTPEQQKSIVDIILDNFKGTFGWLGGVGGAKK